MIFLLIFTSSLSAAETALTSINFIRLKNKTKNIRSNFLGKDKKRIKKIKKVYKFAKNYNESLTAVLIANTLSNTAIATIGTLFFASIFKNETLGAWLSTLIIGLTILILGEIIPKKFAKKHPEATSIKLYYILSFVRFILKPFIIWNKKSNKTITSTENELLELITVIESEGIIETNEKELIKSAITFDEKYVKDIMTHWNKTIFIDKNANWEIVKKIYAEERYSRMPVINKEINKVVGVLNLKDILYNISIDKEINISSLITECLFINDDTKLDDALEYLQRKQIHLAVVTSKKDEYLGIITLEDLIEEIVGEIYDEDDETGWIKEIGNHKWMVYGNAPIKKLFKKHLKINISKKKSYNLNLYEWFSYNSNLNIHLPKNNINKEITSHILTYVYKNYKFKTSLNTFYEKPKNIVFEIEKIANKNYELEYK